MTKYIAFLMAVLSYSCSPKTESAVYPETDMLPEKRPSDFVLKSHTDGGMINHREDLFISKDSCYYKDDDQGVVSFRKFMLSNGQLDSLYEVLKINRFDQIESTLDSTVLDRGGLDVYVYWENGQKGLSADDSGRSFIKEEWTEKWGTVVRYLDTLIPPAVK